VNGTRYQFLARSALAQDQHRILVLAHFLDELVDPLHFGGDADQPTETGARAQLLAQDAIFLVQLDVPHHAIQLGAQLLGCERAW
jgi:hypothetical protein